MKRTVETPRTSIVSTIQSVTFNANNRISRAKAIHKQQCLKRRTANSILIQGSYTLRTMAKAVTILQTVRHESKTNKTTRIPGKGIDDSSPATTKG